jgi:phosphotransferase system enzyme I (PtsP)
LHETAAEYDFSVEGGMKVSRRPVAVSPTVHARGEARLDAMLDLAEEASRPAPLGEVLASLCERITKMLAVDVCSIYLREIDEGGRRINGDLVLRATCGYPQEAVGKVRMRVGEGLTGFAVECLRPVSVARATSDARNKPFAGIDEERFPSLCAVPLVDGGRAVGALVVQRRQPRAFGQREVVLIASLASPVLFALERARMREREHDITAPAHEGSRVHEMALHGEGVVPGRALGTIVVRRHAVHVEKRGAGKKLAPSPIAIADERARLGRALVEAADEIAALFSWALKNAPAGEGSADAARAHMQSLISPARFVLDDARLRERMIDHVEAGATAETAVERVTREYVRVLSGMGDGVLTERALETEALCLRVLGKLSAPSSALPPGSLLAAARLTVCDAIELAAAHGVGAALSGPRQASPGLAVAAALGLPVVAGVRQLFRWAADGDRALLDGDSGLIVVNPSRMDVAAHRNGR